MGIKFKENATVIKSSGVLSDFSPTRDELDILVPFTNVWTNSIIQVSLGGSVMTEDFDFAQEDQIIRLINKDDNHLSDSITIVVFKQPDWAGGL